MEDYRLSQTGQEVQDILNGAAMQVDLNTEVERATDAEGTLQDNIDAEAQARQDADSLLQQGIDDEAQRAKDAEEANAGEIEGIKALIPATATSDNKLADTNFVNSSIQTATAEYRGDYNVVTDLHLAIDATHAQIETLLPTVIAEADKNDYCYVMIPTNAQTPTEIAKIERYKMTSEGWKFEYDVNNSTFTAEEWAAIKSGITSGLVAKLNALPTNADLMARLAGIEGDVDVVEGKVSTIESKIPSTASSENKLVDENHMNTSISTATATYRGDFNLVSDLHLAIDATHAQIATLLGSTIAEADNNDYCYVEIPTNAETPTQIAKVERYKFNGTAWGYEYVLNNSGFTADQWAAINSMITSGLVAKLSALPTNADLLAMFATKQDNLTFDSTPTENSTNPVTSGGVFAADKALSDAIEAILLLIPSAASALNKLVDQNLMNSSISTATATFRGTYNLISGLHLDIDATEGQIAAALSTAISTADNNDYAFVQIPTSAQTPTQIARTDRYKFNGTAWGYEYTLNTSGFTAEQWAAINSGVTDTLVAELANIANLIPSEASQYNKLADKVYVITQIIAHIADFKGEYGTLLELQSVLNPKPGDLGIVRTKDNDGKDVYTFYQYKDGLWNEYYTLSYHPQIKPATTGTTGNYPYNGMGRVELPMNMVNDVNTLTQDMFYKGAQGFREPNTNTIFVIRYDFILGEDITVPANCVLEFDGGSISGAYSIINVGRISNRTNSVIFKGVQFSNPQKQYVKLSWFDYNSVGDSLMTASKFQIVDAVGTWNIDKEITINNDIELFGGVFNCRSGNSVYNIIVESLDVSNVLNYNNTINKESNSISIGIEGDYKYCLLQASNYYFKNNERNGIVGEMMTIDSLTSTSTNFGRCKTVCSYEENVTVKYFNTINVNIHNCNFIASYGETETEGCLLKLVHCTGIIKDCYFTGCSTGVVITDSYSAKVLSCHFEKIYPWAIGFGGATFNSIVDNCTFKKHRHAWTTLGQSYVAKFNTISNCNVSDCFIPIVSHANAFGTLIEGNHISDCDGGVGSYSPNCTTIENVIENCNTGTSPSIYYIEAGPINPIVKNNVIINSRGINIVGNFADSVYNTVSSTAIIEGNTIKNASTGSGITYSPGFTNNDGGRIVISGNTIDNYGYNGILCEGRYVVISNNIVRNSQRGYEGINVNKTSNYTLSGSSVAIKNNLLYYVGTTGSSPKSAIYAEGFADVYLNNNLNFGSGANTYEFVSVVRTHGDTYDTVPSTPLKGDMAFVGTKPQWWNGTSWVDATGTPV